VADGPHLHAVGRLLSIVKQDLRSIQARVMGKVAYFASFSDFMRLIQVDL